MGTCATELVCSVLMIVCLFFSQSAKWARLGDLDLKSTADKSQPADYKIVQHVLHPEYTVAEHYNDIALFRLNSNVKFSSFVRPICLNVDPSLNPAQQIATGWGRTGSG